MRYRYVPKTAVRYTESTRPDTAAAVAQDYDYDTMTYREIQERAVSLGINGRQTREELIYALQEADKA